MEIRSPEGRPYHVSLLFESTLDGHAAWVAKVEELPGCVSQGPTVDDALRGLADAADAWLTFADEHGSPIPEPRTTGDYSGRFVVRAPASLHEALVREAARERVSLNAFVTTALAGAVGWRTQMALPTQLGITGEQVTRVLEDAGLRRRVDVPARPGPQTA